MPQPVFAPVPAQFNFPKSEEEILRFWAENGIYHQSLEQRKDAPPFIFYEGPPTANGLPHPGHCLTRTVKDVFPRYQTMAGRRCKRKAGWDTHGLPVEIEVCKELGIMDGGKAAIEAFGVEAFNKKCLESVFRYTKEWEDLTHRLGFWVDLPEAYVTYHQSYVESVWWALKTLFDKGLLYQGHKVVWWWAQGGTALSAGEVGEGYRETDDPAITVKFRLTKESVNKLGLTSPDREGEGIGEADVFLLAWTTTPWTLSSNCALAVGEEVDYVVARHKDEYFILAATLTEKYDLKPEDVVKTLQGRELVGLRYTPVFKYSEPQPIAGANTTQPFRCWTVIPGDFVTLDQGTGIVHCAPAFGEDDYRVCKENNIGFLCFVKPDGTFDERVSDHDPNPHDPKPLAGMFCKSADKAIIHLLKNQGALVKHDQYRHPYPFCPRAENDPLIQYARKSWFIRTQQFKEQFLQNNAQIGWQPEHIQEGRFGDFLRNNIDWALSRERYWGTPLPIWVCEQTGQMEAVGSYEELLQKPGVQGVEVWMNAKKANPELSEHLKVHKPYIDAITYDSPFVPRGTGVPPVISTSAETGSAANHTDTGKMPGPHARMRRVSEVIDCWFDSGCMPFAQWGYPQTPHSAAKLTANFPADFISEALDQTRGWFYSLLAISTMLFKDCQFPIANCQLENKVSGSLQQSTIANRQSPIAYPHPFRNCICLGLLLGEDGLKLSKRKKNYKEPGYLFDHYGADALRWSLLAGQPPTASVRFTERGVEEALREFLIRWYNVYSFFVIYANLDGFDPHVSGRACPGDWSAPTRGRPLTESGYARPVTQRCELDRWMLSELQATIQNVRSALDHYDPYTAANAISSFVDALSNWYVRRSRPRFWAYGWNQDKRDAYDTLYECLVTLARLAAPFVPFFAETTWQNLVRRANPGAPSSVHLADYPQMDASKLDRDLMAEMAIVREVVSTGLSARASTKLKVRQPLSLVELVVADGQNVQRLQRHQDLVLDELNVKRMEFTVEPQKYVNYEVRPNFKALGPKLGKKLPMVKAALAQADGGALYREMQSGQITLSLADGEQVELTGSEVEVRLNAKPGFSAAQGAHAVVILATEITPELKREGLARELIHALQAIRKDLDLPYDARLAIAVETADAELQQMLDEHRSVITHEVLANSLVTGRLDGVEGRETNLEDRKVMLFVKTVG